MLDNAHLKAHFTTLKDWYDAGLFGFYGVGWHDNQTPFETQEVAMWIGTSGSYGGLTQTAGFEFSAAFLPYWERVPGAGTNTFIGGAALYAMSGFDAAQNKATAEFFRFLTRADVQFLWHRETGYVPITHAAYDMAKMIDFYDEVPAAEIGIRQLTLPSGDWSKGYRLGFYVQVRDIMNREYARIFAGETSVDEAFRVITEEGNRYLERFAKTQR